MYTINTVGIPRLALFYRAEEHFVHAERIGTVLFNKHRSIGGLQRPIAVGKLCHIDDGGIAERTVPILDGSSYYYVENIKRVGIEEQEADKDYYVIKRKVEFNDPATGSQITLLPDEQFSITSMISFDSQFLSSQFATLDDMSKFADEVASMVN